MIGNDEEIDMVEWLNRKHRQAHDFNEDNLHPALNFLILWNIYEAKIGKNHVTDVKMCDHAKQIAERIGSNVGKYEVQADWFRQRYINGDGKYNTKHDTLIPENMPEHMKKRQEEVLRRIDAMLVPTNRTSKEYPYTLLCGLLMIAYRIRNNLFHGIKTIPTWPEYAPLIRKVNGFLRDIMDEV